MNNYNKVIWVVFLVCIVFFIQFASPTPVSAAAYIVKPGDTLTYIARQFGTTVESIVEVNNIIDPDLIIVGQILEIPMENEGDLTASNALIPRERLLVADFDDCTGINNVGGIMGAAYQAPGNQLEESYLSTPDRGCVAKLTYEVKDWGAFWLKLGNANLTTFKDNSGFLTFDIRADAPIPRSMKIELKRFCASNASCGELSVYTMTGITSEWETRRVPLDGFGTTGWAATLSSWDAIEELVFTFEAHNSGNNGFVYIDNIAFVR